MDIQDDSRHNDVVIYVNEEIVLPKERIDSIHNDNTDIIIKRSDSKKSKPSLQQKIQDYINDFTIHGLTKILRGSSVLEVLFWFSISVGSLYFVGSQGVKIIRKYIDHGVYTDINVSFSNNIKFPSITFCDYNHIGDLLEIYCGKPFDDNSHFCKQTIKNETETMAEVSLKVIDNETLWSSPFFEVLDCWLTGNKRSCFKHIKSQEFLNHVCFTWNYDGKLYDSKNVVELVFQSKNTLNIPKMIAVSHEPHKYLDVSEIHSGIKMDSGIHHLIIDQTHFKRLPFPFPTKCQENQTAELSHVSPKFSTDLCIAYRIKVKLLKKCGGVNDIFLPLVGDKIIKYGRNQTAKQFSQCRDIFEDETKDIDQCAVPCRETKVQTTRHTDERHYGNRFTVYIRLVHPQSNTLIEEKELYTWEEMISEIGGLLGLAAGISLISSVEILVTFIMQIVNLIRSKKQAEV